MYIVFVVDIKINNKDIIQSASYTCCKASYQLEYQFFSVFFFSSIFCQWDKIIHNYQWKWTKILTIKIWTWHPLFRHRLQRKIQCFLLFEINHNILSGHFLSLSINVSASGFKVELTKLNDTLYCAKKTLLLLIHVNLFTIYNLIYFQVRY